MEKAVIYINTNITTGEHFDRNGQSFRPETLGVTFRSSFTVCWNLFTDTPDADSSGADITKWSKADFSNCGAKLTCDNNRVYRLNATLGNDILADAEQEYTQIPISGISSSQHLSNKGILTIYCRYDQIYEMPYKEVLRSNSGYLIVLEEPFKPGNDITKGTSVACSESPLFDALFTAESKPEEGVFVFDCYCNSEKLSRAIAESNANAFATNGIEILPFMIDGKTLYDLPAYLVEDFTIFVPMGEAGFIASSYSKGSVIEYLADLILEGVDVQVFSEETGWIEYDQEQMAGKNFTLWRMKLAAKELPDTEDGSENDETPYPVWSDPVPLVSGATGPAAGFGEVTASAETVAEDVPAAVEVETSGDDKAKNFNIKFRIPRGLTGKQGERGPAFQINAIGKLADRTQYDNEAKGFSFLDIDTGNVYFKRSVTPGDWSNPMPFKGDKEAKPFYLQGSWINDKEYSESDAITYSGSMYIAIKSNRGVVPGTDPETWRLYVSKGEPGKQGIQGIPGVLLGNHVDLQTVTDGFLHVTDETIPVSVEINGTVYPAYGIEKTNGGYRIPVAPILAAANLEYYAGTWRVWRAGGGKTQITIGDNGNWFIDDIDSGRKATGQGSNVVISPTPPSAVYNGLIWIQSANEQYMNIDPISVVTGTDEPGDVPDGTIWIESEA